MELQGSRNVPRSNRAFREGVNDELARVAGSLYEAIVFRRFWISVMEFAELF